MRSSGEKGVKEKGCGLSSTGGTKKRRGGALENEKSEREIPRREKNLPGSKREVILVFFVEKVKRKGTEEGYRKETAAAQGWNEFFKNALDPVCPGGVGKGRPRGAPIPGEGGKSALPWRGEQSWGKRKTTQEKE